MGELESCDCCGEEKSEMWLEVCEICSRNICTSCNIVYGTGVCICEICEAEHPEQVKQTLVDYGVSQEMVRELYK